MSVEDLIKELLRELLPLVKKRILVMFSGGTVNLELLLDILIEVNLNDYDLVISENAQQIINQDLLKTLKGNTVTSMVDLEVAIKKADFVLIPVLSRNTLSKIALGISDNLLTTGISRALMMNKEIVIVRDSYDPQNSVNIAKGLSKNVAYNAMIMNYEKQLESMDVKFIDTGEFRMAVEGNSLKKVPVVQSVEGGGFCNHSILTLSDINGNDSNSVLKIRESTIITPLARDYIQSKGIKLEFQSISS
ncbi:flavoprotein [Pelosinus sp. sgz500959]|uniref:flavoprotein n=1 Tax=Pelosinus sp. sgz500959 TaxID=3242472 RepID=UPI0036735300